MLADVQPHPLGVTGTLLSLQSDSVHSGFKAAAFWEQSQWTPTPQAGVSFYFLLHSCFFKTGWTQAVDWNVEHFWNVLRDGNKV